MWFYNSVYCSWLIEDLFTPRGTFPDAMWFVSGNSLQIIKNNFFLILGDMLWIYWNLMP